MKMESLSYRPRSLRMLYGHDVSEAFDRSKRTATRCSFFRNASTIKSFYTNLMILLTLKLVCTFERRLFDSRNHVSLRLIILSRVFLVHLVGFVRSLFFEDRDNCDLLS